jgi:hypothetical protein
MMQEKPDMYEFEMIHRGAKCSCTCPCNPSNPVDVTVVFSAAGEKQAVTVNPQMIKKMS